MKRSVLAAAAGVAVLASPAVASAATLTVDDDRVQCKKAEFQSINAAVQAAAPGDTVRVCPGAYAERVVVDKPLDLYGPRHANGGANSRDPFPGAPDPKKEAIVVNAGQGGFDVPADDVSIIGFTVLGTSTNPADYPNAGIYVRKGAGRVIEGNVVTRNRLGVYLEGAQQALEVERNGIFDNTGAGGAPAGGLFAAGGQLDEVSISRNDFVSNGQFAMNVGGGSAGGLVIEHNASELDRTFLVIGGTTGGRVAYNRVEDVRASGVFGFGSNTGLEIEHNVFDAADTNSNGSAIRMTQSFGGGADEGTVIRYNRSRGFSFDGVSLNATNGALITHNEMDEMARSGFRLQNSDGGTFSNNRATDSGMSGLRAEAQSTGNVIVKNDLRGNAGVDCSDSTEGPGTSGTANVWEDDRGDDEDRPGICVTPQP